MKTERRHELQTNELADWLGKHIEQVRPYSKVLTGGAIIIVAAIFAVMFLAGQKSRQQASAWSALYDAAALSDVDRAERLEKLAELQGGTAAGIWAQQMAADALLAQGAAELQIDRESASRQIGRALKAYQAVIDQTDDDMLKPRAMIGVAQCYEALLDNVSQAEQQYQQMIDAWPESAMADIARERLRLLKQQSTTDFLAWLDEQEPKVAAGPDSSLFDDMLEGTGLPSQDGTDPSAAGGDFPFGPLDPPADTGPTGDQANDTSPGAADTEDATSGDRDAPWPELPSDLDAPGGQGPPVSESSADEQPGEETSSEEGTETPDTAAESTEPAVDAPADERADEGTEDPAVDQ